MVTEQLTQDEYRSAMHWLERRAADLWPQDSQELQREVIVSATAAHIVGHTVAALDPLTANHLRNGIEQMLMLMGTDERPTLMLGTVAAVAQVAQLGLPDAEAADRIHSVWVKLGDDGAVGPWQCMICMKQFPDDYEPGLCDNCGTRLMRHRKKPAP